MSTLEIEDDVAKRLKPYHSDMGSILQLGLRAWQSRMEPGFSDLRDVLETLATLPEPQEVLKLRPTPSLQRRIEELLEKSRTVGFTSAERGEWEQVEYVEHLVTMAKLNATMKLQRAAV